MSSTWTTQTTAGKQPARATDYRSLAPFQAAVTRRRFLQLGGTAAGVAIAAGAGTQLGGIASDQGRRGDEAGSPHRHDRRSQACRDPHAGEPVVRPLLRQPAGRARLRRQAGAEVPERHHHLRAAGHGPDGPRLPAAVPHGLVEGERPERRGPGPQLGRRPQRPQQRPVEQLGAGQDRADDGLLHPRRHPVPVRPGRRVHHLRWLPSGDSWPRRARTGCTSGPARAAA